MKGSSVERHAHSALGGVLVLALVMGLVLALASCGSSGTTSSSATTSTTVGGVTSTTADDSSSSSLTTMTTNPANTTLVTSGVGANSQGPGAQIIVKDGKLQPTEIQVTVGTAVQFVNDEADDSQVLHEFVADDGSFDTGQLVPGDTYRVTFQKQGTVSFHDKLHPEIKGTVVVD